MDFSWETALLQVVMMLGPTVVGAVAGFFGGKYKEAKQEHQNNAELRETLRKGMVALLGDKLDQQYAAYQAGENFDTERRQKVKELAETYAACGGDGVRDSNVKAMLKV